MLLWQFISIYISVIISEILSNSNSILFTVCYIGTFCILNGLTLSDILPKQQLSLQMIIVPILALIFASGNNTLNTSNIFNSLLVESIASAIVEEALFRQLIPNNFANKYKGIFISGILFAIIHIKSLHIDTNILIKIFIVSMLFNILMFQAKPNNIIYHFMWNFITLTLFKSTDINNTTITNIELSNNTIIILAFTIFLNGINILNSASQNDLFIS